ncbi:MAG: hypothetical protein NTW97_02945 [Candidatus Krumholzibacteria bacterium]|nr:hypothetical protein [Candidatus Krumholzibacteria bacterium]
MRKLFVLAMVALSAVAAGNACAADNAPQTITYQVSAINEITVSGNPGALIVVTAVPGAQPTAVTDATTTYAITTNIATKKITGAINTAMPANTSLKVTLVAPTGGTSSGQVTLTASAQDLVTGITTLAESGLGISYNFSATLAAGVVASAQKTMTLTVADGV